jgi:hypothetical protein
MVSEIVRLVVDARLAISMFPAKVLVAVEVETSRGIVRSSPLNVRLDD